MRLAASTCSVVHFEELSEIANPQRALKRRCRYQASRTGRLEVPTKQNKELQGRHYILQQLHATFFIFYHTANVHEVVLRA